MGCSPAEIVYDDSHYPIDIKDGSNQVYLWKACLVQKNNKMADDLTEYDIQYTTKKAIKGSVLADHLAHQAVDDYQSMNLKFPDKNIKKIVQKMTVTYKD